MGCDARLQQTRNGFQRQNPRNGAQIQIRVGHLSETSHTPIGETQSRLRRRPHFGRQNGRSRIRDRVILETYDQNDLYVTYQSALEPEVPRLQAYVQRCRVDHRGFPDQPNRRLFNYDNRNPTIDAF